MKHFPRRRKRRKDVSQRRKSSFVFPLTLFGMDSDGCLGALSILQVDGVGKKERNSPRRVPRLSSKGLRRNPCCCWWWWWCVCVCLLRYFDMRLISSLLWKLLLLCLRLLLAPLLEEKMVSSLSLLSLFSLFSLSSLSSSLFSLLFPLKCLEMNFCTCK